MCARKRAITLLEVLVSLGLAGLIVGIFASVLVPTFQASTRNSARVELQQEAQVVASRLQSDLQKATPAGLGLLVPSAGDRTAVVSINSLLDVNSSQPPVQIFDKQLILYIYRPTARALVRRLWPPSPTPPVQVGGLTLGAEFAVRPEPARMQDWAANPAAGEVKLSAHVLEFAVTSPVAAPLIASPLKLQLVLEKTPDSRLAPLRYEISQSFSLRNGE